MSQSTPTTACQEAADQAIATQIDVIETTQPEVKPVSTPPVKTQKTVKSSPLFPPISTPAHSHELGFTSLTQELNNITLPAKGSIPAWLQGSFITIGPGSFELGDSKACNWLDGFGMIHQFAFNEGAVTYTNKLIQSSYYQDCCKNGKLRGSAPEQKKSTWAKLTSAISNAERPKYDNTNINIALFNNQLMALTETPHALPIDHKTMATKGSFAFDDKLITHISSPHPLFDPTTKEWFGVAIQYAHTSNYIVYKMNADSTQRIPIISIPVGYPSYIHSFGLTPHYIILTETPFIVSPYDLLLSDNAFIEVFTWKPKRGTSFIVIDRKTGKQVGTYKTEAFFTMHHVNAYEKEGDIIVDLIAYKDPEITRAFTMQNLCNPRIQLPDAQLKRYKLDTKNKKVVVSKLSSHNLELPNINPALLMHEHRYTYATVSEHGFAQQLIKLDLHSKRHATWHAKGCYPTEPIFVSKPHATKEDEGLILCLILDSAAKKSFLLILDAATFKEVGRIYTPHHIPFTAHSKFFELD
jgi:carotenoid cleavage dioxygenase-like enzyme